jgi:hypothetical protein
MRTGSHHLFVLALLWNSSSGIGVWRQHTPRAKLDAMPQFLHGRSLRGDVPALALTSHAVPLLSLAVITILCKLPTLDTPAYWDEMSWLGQADSLSQRGLVTAIPGLRPAAAFWGHPPGLHFMLAALGKVFGVSVPVAHTLIAIFAAIGVCATYLVARQLYGSATGWLAAAVLLLSPLYFAQSGMFLADVPVAALGTLAIYFVLTDRFRPYVICASCMVLLKETAIALVVALLLYRFLIMPPMRRARLSEVAKYCIPLIVIGAFAVLQRITTGKFFIIYDFEFKLFELTPDLVRRQFQLITRWIFLEQYRWVFTGLIALNLLINEQARRRRELWLFVFVVVLSGYSFSILYFLPRYLLPVLPLFYIFAARSVLDLAQRASLQFAAAAALLSMAVWSLIVNPMSGNGEQSLRYLGVVSMNKAAVDRIAGEFPETRVLTTWPHTAEMASPLQGYVKEPIATKHFKSAADLTESDLILVSQPSIGDAVGLREIARSSARRLIMRREQEGAWTELYAAATPPR